MKISPQEFYETCSTQCLEYVLHMEPSGENKRIIRDILETRKEKESK